MSLLLRKALDTMKTALPLGSRCLWEGRGRRWGQRCLWPGAEKSVKARGLPRGFGVTQEIRVISSRSPVEQRGGHGPNGSSLECTHRWNPGCKDQLGPFKLPRQLPSRHPGFIDMKCELGGRISQGPGWLHCALTWQNHWLQTRLWAPGSGLLGRQAPGSHSGGA